MHMKFDLFDQMDHGSAWEQQVFDWPESVTRTLETGDGARMLVRARISELIEQHEAALNAEELEKLALIRVNFRQKVWSQLATIEQFNPRDSALIDQWNLAIELATIQQFQAGERAPERHPEAAAEDYDICSEMALVTSAVAADFRERQQLLGQELNEADLLSMQMCERTYQRCLAQMAILGTRHQLHPELSLNVEPTDQREAVKLGRPVRIEEVCHGGQSDARWTHAVSTGDHG